MRGGIRECIKYRSRHYTNVDYVSIFYQPLEYNNMGFPLQLAIRKIYSKTSNGYMSGL